ncbi:GGDEF domain-containing protein [Pseudomarimonas salicorniae]|uniref:diguanylate cyclase n=1 Tax=Pseudomarimonas salicorniae TaxID=2933270 RepID=A0ABT0GN30_9GAMM|nr:GGDEF domain-containing protein [Lysobacter sp. CAU 1642]MCK7595407.1 GGDEF domain-containing protein [Lysobacter sp. CAU 1642]
MLDSVVAVLALGLACVLAVSFHRYRAAQLSLVLALMAAALAFGEAREIFAAQRFGPLLLLVCAAMSEPRLASRRHAALLAAILLIVGPVMLAPPRLFEAMGDAAAFPLGGQAPRVSGFVFCFVASMVCLGRWVWRGQPIDLGLTLALLPAAAAVGRGQSAGVLYLAAAVLIIVAILYHSYRMAFIDTLTGLPNRRALDETLSRLSGPFSLAMIDIDHFKGFNDTYGHDAGDIVLREVGGLLRRHGGGNVFRYGGEEFCAVFPRGDLRSAMRTLEGARGAVEAARVAVPAPRKRRSEQAAAATKDVSVTISAGCADRGEERRSAGEVLKLADQALYKAKEKGRNRVEKR